MPKIKITELALRDAHQSLHATRMVTADMLPIAEKMNRVGYWSVETWGGATFDSCIRFLNEDPWERIRTLKKAIPNTPHQMLLRGQSILGYRHYADDVVEKCVERMAVNGVDVFRVFDALNDPRNFMVPMKAVKKAGKHAQAAISYTVSPVHTIESYAQLAKSLQKMGADSICIKDMASLLSPYTAYELVKAIKKAVDLPVHIHSHSTTGMSVATLVKAAEAGAEMIDTAIASMAMGPSHSPTESLVEIFKGTEYDTGLDMDLLLEISAYFRDVVRPKYAQFESSFSGADTRILKAAIPGGMLSNLESQLRQQKAFDKLDEVLKENARVCKDFGYPPLVTPTSQIVGTQAVLNVLMGRYQNLTAESMNLLVGNYGKTPADPDPELVKKALKGLNMEKPVTERPADLIPNELAKIEDELKQKTGKSEVNIDDVLTYAMFPQVALKFFDSRAKGPVVFEAKKADAKPAAAPAPAKPAAPASYVMHVDGRDYQIVVGDGTVKVDGKDYPVAVKAAGAAAATPAPAAAPAAPVAAPAAPAAAPVMVAEQSTVEAPVGGTVLRLLKANGDTVAKDESVIIIESMKMELEVKAKSAGVITYKIGTGESAVSGQALAIIGGVQAAPAPAPVVVPVAAPAPAPVAPAPVAPAPVAPAAGAGTPVEAPVGGTVLRFLKANGDTVAQDESVIIIESMKMELEVKSKVSGIITYKVGAGESAVAGQALAIVSSGLAAPAPVPAPAPLAAPVVAPAPTPVAPAPAAGAGTPVEAPVGGTVLRLLKTNGDTVAKDESVIVIESMKMELEVKSKVPGVITYKIGTGESATAGQALAVVS